jgi:hypothetical protein
MAIVMRENVALGPFCSQRSEEQDYLDRHMVLIHDSSVAAGAASRRRSDSIGYS